MILTKKIPQAIIFDTDNTLYHYQPAHQAAMNVLENKVEINFGIKKKIFNKKFFKSKKKDKNFFKNNPSFHSKLF